MRFHHALASTSGITRLKVSRGILKLAVLTFSAIVSPPLFPIYPSRPHFVSRPVYFTRHEQRRPPRYRRDAGPHRRPGERLHSGNCHDILPFHWTLQLPRTPRPDLLSIQTAPRPLLLIHDCGNRRHTNLKCRLHPQVLGDRLRMGVLCHSNRDWLGPFSYRSSHIAEFATTPRPFQPEDFTMGTNHDHLRWHCLTHLHHRRYCR
jgi:hypothetical protein